MGYLQEMGLGEQGEKKKAFDTNHMRYDWK
jgi:hypothetical protein